MLMFDIECYPNAFGLGFKDINTQVVTQFNKLEGSFSSSDIKSIRNLMENNTLVTFNGIGYDLLLAKYLLNNPSCTVGKLNQISSFIINGCGNVDNKQFGRDIALDISRRYEKKLKQNPNFNGKFQYYEIEAIFKVGTNYNHIDLMKIAPSNCSLKLYGARLHTTKLQDLPYAFGTYLTSSEWDEVCKYNINDLQLTEDLYNALKPQIDLRVRLSAKYGIKLLNKGDATMGLEILSKQMSITKSKITKDYTFDYVAPTSINFENKQLQTILTHFELIHFRFTLLNLAKNSKSIEDVKTIIDKCGVKFDSLKDVLLSHKIFNRVVLLDKLRNVQDGSFTINPNTFLSVVPKWLDKEVIKLAGCSFNIGFGGLHSQERNISFIPNENEVMLNADVVSYYPSIIFAYPKQASPTHVDHEQYSSILEERFVERAESKIRTKAIKKELKALKTNTTLGYKEGKDLYKKLIRESIEVNTTNSGNKIILNGGGFGKQGDKWSKTLSPKSMVFITLTGQLLLLQLIEQLDKIPSVKICSANTDGIEYIINKDDISLAKSIIQDWQMYSYMNMSHGEYKSLHCRAINDYVAVYDGYCKAKGAFAEKTISTNPVYPVVFEAIREHLLNGIDMETFIKSEKRIHRFTTSRTVTGGAFMGEYKYNERVEVIKNGEHQYHMIPKHKRVKLDICEKTGDKNDYKRPKMEYKKIDGNVGTYQGKYIGKVVRYYYTTNGGDFKYVKSGNAVPNATGVIDALNLDEVNLKVSPIDYDRYVTLAYKHLKELGC